MLSIGNTGTDLFNSIFQLKATFSALQLSDLVVSGTGFYIVDSSRKVSFVTNRHVLDPKMTYGSDTPYQLREVCLQLRAKANGVFAKDIVELPVANTLTCIKLHDDADVAIIYDPKVSSLINLGYDVNKIMITELADEEFLSSQVSPMDAASFIGFPKVGDTTWCDQLWNFPVARTVNIASLPSMSFTHPLIRSEDVMLVSGLSFGGSSGSPLFLHEKGIKAQAPLSSPYVPPKLIGIMAGHMISDGPMAHSGLSYAVRSTSILRLLQID